ncbi:MAG: gamma-glutamyltransferase family protein [Gammaproteobacteria bacterium]|nr:gamma-glutamyltransferase family protein [Gammaproteobacteria bacterium]
MSNSFDWRFPYESRRAPVLARNVVTTSQPLASQAGLQMIQDGGNAVDAILAAAITLTVVEPCNNGVGSDAFAQIFDGERLRGYTGSGRSPKAWHPSRFANYDEMPRHGWDSVTVPGAVRTWVDLHERHGSLPFSKLFESAIQYARDGFHIGHKTAEIWQASAEMFRGFGAFQRHFCSAGRAPQAGELYRRPELADTLEAIADSQGESFYRGDLAQAIVKQSDTERGCLTCEDLADHTGLWQEPLSMDYHNVRLHEIPPSGQGLAALLALGMLRHTHAATLPVDSAEWVHMQVESMKIAIRAAFDHIADMDAMKSHTTVEELLDDTSLRHAAQTIGDRVAHIPPRELPTSSDTVYLAAADASGMMVSYIQSNYMGFGSGIVIDGTGIAMQNRGAGFVLTPNHPNQVAGAKRPYHTIIPGFITDLDNRPLAVFGVMGGHMQHQGHVQMVSRIYDYGQNPQAASDAPRWHVTPDFEVVLESGYEPAIEAKLRSRGHAVAMSANQNLFGGAQLICRMQDGYCAASDHRKEGCALGF